jgi:hypothetical protein
MAPAWHQIFDENEADEAAAELNRNGLLRTPEGPGLQIIVKVRNKTHRVYAVKQRLSDWKLQDSVRGYDGSYSGYLSGQCKNSVTVAYPLLFPFRRRRPSLQISTNCLLASGKIILIFVRKFRPSGWAGGQILFGANDRKWREGDLR